MSQIPSKEIDRQLATPATVLVQGTQFPERLLNAHKVPRDFASPSVSFVTTQRGACQESPA